MNDAYCVKSWNFESSQFYIMEIIEYFKTEQNKNLYPRL